MLNFQYLKLSFVVKNNIPNFIFIQKTILETLFFSKNPYSKLYSHRHPPIFFS